MWFIFLREGDFMAKLVITRQHLLTPAELRTLLEQMEVQSSTMSDTLNLLRELVTFEQKYGLASDVFYARFMRGEMGDDMPYIKWAGRYELYLEAKHELENQLVEKATAV
jgi:hypothetical protein